MEAYDVLVLATSSLIMLILIHVSVFGVVRWMYPQPQPQPQVRFVEPAPPPPTLPFTQSPTLPFTQSPTLPFTQPSHVKQEVNVPTYAAPVSVEAPREDRGPETGKPSGGATERPAWLVAVDPKTLE